MLSPDHFDQLSNLYFESCVRSSPHSELAEKCYQRFEQNVYFGYTGSSGTHLPEKVKDQLLALWAQAIRMKNSQRSY